MAKKICDRFVKAKNVFAGNLHLYSILLQTIFTKLVADQT